MNRLMILVFTVLLGAGCAATAQVQTDNDHFTQAQLDSMLAPVALYPDSVLSHLLIAATYPLEVIQAARWSRENPGLHGEDAVAAVGLDLRLDEQLAPLTIGEGAHDGERRPAPHEGVGRRPPERRQRGQPGQGLEQVGLALAVGADERGEAGSQVEPGRGVAAEVGQPEGADLHARRAAAVSSPAPA